MAFLKIGDKLFEFQENNFCELVRFDLNQNELFGFDNKAAQSNEESRMPVLDFSELLPAMVYSADFTPAQKNSCQRISLDVW